MLWIAIGLFALGAACGASIRLLAFIGVLIAGAIIAVVVAMPQGLGAALLAALATIMALQVGYVAGMILRAFLGRSALPEVATEGAGGKPPVTTPLGIIIRGSAADRDAQRRDRGKP
jgi:hypothetical protein